MPEKTIAQKMFIKPGQSVLLMNAPSYMGEKMGFAGGVKMVTIVDAPADVVIIFAIKRSEMSLQLQDTKLARGPASAVWLAYPKAGQLGTDLKRETLWEVATPFGLDAVSQVAIDDVWSGLKFKAK